MRTIHRDIVAAVIFSKDNKILMGMKDPQDLIYARTWGIPGGGIEKGESQIEALVREVLEETGIDIRGYPIEFIDDTNKGESEKRLKETGEIVYVTMNYFTYKVTLTDKNAHEVDVELQDDLVKSQWVTVEELVDVHLNEPTKWLFKKMKLL